MGTDRISRKQPAPHFMQICLKQIEPDVTSKQGEWLTRLRYTPRAVPFLKLAAISQLELAQPLQVSLKFAGDAPPKEKVYRLEAGLRTFQLLREQKSSWEKVWAIVVPPASATQRLSNFAFDAVVANLIQRPDGNDLAILAAALLDEDRELRDAVGALIDVGSDSAIADALGLARSTMHRLSRPYRKLSSDETKSSGQKVSLEIDSEEEEQEN